MPGIRSFQQALTSRLLAWSVFSVAVGLLSAVRGGLWRGLGIQFIAWGSIDALIALLGRAFMARRPLETPAAARREAQMIRRILWFNTVLDLFYIMGGWLLLRRGQNKGHAFTISSGWGVIVQGGYLALFDLFHALRVPTKDKSPMP